MPITLADALLRRKELKQQLDRMEPLRKKDLFESVVERVAVTDAIDNVVAKVTRIEWTTFERAYNKIASNLRKIDAIVQRANWTTNVEVPEGIMTDEEPPAA